MAFDQGTRNRLQRLVGDCRRLLVDEFSLQLQQTYGLDPKAGEITPLDRLAHLSDRDRHTAQLLRETLAHYRGAQADNAEQRKLGIERIVREQAFTVLNRLAALLMMEARGLLLPTLSQGQQSQAFELYRRVAGTALGETGDTYRVFLFSLFDEFAQELPALFDRYAPQGRLFPRESALMQVLDQLNHHEVQPLWAEDETLGWIYQYFNSAEERKAMRKASQAPRNSRELAVRNQFFTPRYVVEFLVDNTLGRLWFDWTGGQTSLRDRCQYLLVKPDEQPEPAPHLRDPRTIKLLDPACGSMHFGLYAFDLFLEIYREAWDWEQTHGPGSLRPSPSGRGAEGATLKPLSQSYPDQKAYLLDVPRLITEHNLYGVDIDPRAAQIASLALWLRAQRAWHQAAVKAQDRPPIGNGQVLAAIAPPAERDLRERFARDLDPLDAELFEKTLQMLKGLPELGMLLQFEQELSQLIRQVYVGKGTDLFAEQEQENWQQAESRLRAALTTFAQEARASYQGRLFAQDALQGLRLIDLTRARFDVVVMNPPFGALAASTKDRLAKAYPRSKNDLLAIFVERGLALLRSGGRLGAITSRTCFFLSSFQKWREEIVLGVATPEVMADLGHGVMDDAMVEAAAYCLVKHG
ncbi:MAG: SAM-dependent methyltransferase [Chromatiaceae bacterium]|nr:MAG: SAM-dependent methyltransferase [Chromatiaceae bacterium]